MQIEKKKAWILEDQKAFDTKAIQIWEPES